jgi:hypothetical protein
MGVPGDLRHADLLRAVTSVIVLKLDLKLIVATNSGDGKMRDGVKITTAGKKIAAVKKIDALLTRRDSVKRNVGVWRYAVVWRTSGLVTPSALLVSELLQRSTDRKKKPVAEIVGRTGPRCGVDPPPSLLLAAGLPM